MQPGGYSYAYYIAALAIGSARYSHTTEIYAVECATLNHLPYYRPLSPDKCRSERSQYHCSEGRSLRSVPMQCDFYPT